MSVLAHVVASMRQRERRATQVLAYILNGHPELVRAFVGLLDEADIRFQPSFRIQTEKGDKDGVIPGLPDMKIRDEGGTLRVLVENKFWADLTAAQPVQYLKMLQKERKDGSSALLFIVPEKRVTQIWNELKAKCCEAGFDLVKESSERDRVKWVSVGTDKMLVTDWRNVLCSLEQVTVGDEIRSDLFQFRRMVEELEGSEVFLALRPGEVKNVDVPQRMINYMDVLDSVCDRLPHKGMGIMCGQSQASLGKYKSIYRNLQHGGKVVGWLAISFFVWHQVGTTPLWLWMNGDVHLPKRFEKLGELFEGMYVSKSGYSHFIPIQLKSDVEKERVIEGAVDRICEIVRKLT